MSKGSNRRPTDEDKYREAFERIFGKPAQIKIDSSFTAEDLMKPMNGYEDQIKIASETIGYRINGK